MNEFDIIREYFEPLSPHGLDDDAAVIGVPAGHELVVSTDTLNAGTHILPDAAPGDIARRALRTALSDLAAMGAAPLCYQLSLALPGAPSPEWLGGFSTALREDQETFGLHCSGGDTTNIKGALSVSLTVFGLVEYERAVTRAGAKPGDALVLSGSVGDAYLFLKHRDNDVFKTAYYRPQPRFDLLEPIREYARAAVDISDGLLADLGHICKTSGVAAQVAISPEMFSPAAREMIGQGKTHSIDLLCGGDDYQLLLAVPEKDLAAFLEAAPGCFKIGSFSQGAPDIKLQDESGQIITPKHTGWSHF